MTTTSSSGISFSGLFSGLDTESIISQLMTIERQPQDLLKKQITKLDYQKADLQTVNTSMLALQATLTDFSNGVILGNKAVSDDEKVVTSSADASADQGVYTVSVNNLAYQHRVGSDPQAGGVYGGGAGAMNIQIGIDNFSVNVAGGQSLSQIAHNINNSMSGGALFTTKGLATVITNPSNGKQTLVIQSNNTGTANAMTISDTLGTPAQSLGLITALGAINHTLQAAQDADVTINGVAVKNSSNSITTAVTGVTFNIEGFGTANVTVGADDSQIVSQVQSFVDQFNKTTNLLDQYMNEQPVDSPTTADDARKGDLQNDSDLGAAKSGIRLSTTGYLDNTLAKYKMLSDIGIDSEGLVGSTISNNITFDATKLQAALKDDKTQVTTLLQGFADKMNTYMDSQTKVTVAQSMAGTFYSRILSIGTQETSINQDISNWDTRLSDIETRYRNQFSAMETLLQQLQTQGTYLTNQLNALNGTSSAKSSTTGK